MVKLVFCLRRLPRLTPAEFLRYWRETHAPLVQRHRRALGVLRYVQTHSPAAESGLGLLGARLRRARNTPEPYDGMAELWYASLEAMQAMSRDPAARAAGRELLEDEKRFVDMARSPIWLAREHLIFDHGT